MDAIALTITAVSFLGIKAVAEEYKIAGNIHTMIYKWISK
jgi:hypothetical protein